MKKTIILLLAIVVLADTTLASSDSFDKKFSSGKHSYEYSEKYKDQSFDSDYGRYRDGSDRRDMKCDYDKCSGYYGMMIKGYNQMKGDYSKMRENYGKIKDTNRYETKDYYWFIMMGHYIRMTGNCGMMTDCYGMICDSCDKSIIEDCDRIMSDCSRMMDDCDKMMQGCSIPIEHIAKPN